MPATNRVVGAMNGASTQPRTRLYNLQPYRSADGLSEGLLSYLVRLARAHCVRPRDLVRLVLAESRPDIARLCYNSFYAEYANTVNGLGKYARLFADRLNELTGRQGLDEITMLPWADLVPDQSERFIARHRRWCPHCLNEQEGEHHEVFWPLVWSLENYRICHLHLTPLQGHCPHCGSSQDFIPSLPTLMHCGNCGGSLAASNDSKKSVLTSERTIVGLLQSPGTAKDADLKAAFDTGLRKIIDNRYCGNRAAMCRAMGWNAWALKGWLDQKQKVSFPKLIRLVSEQGLSLPGMEQDEKPKHDTPGSTSTQRKRSARPLLTPERRSEIRIALQSTLLARDAPTMSSIARSAGITRSTLKYWFPDECKAIVARSRDALRRRSAKATAKVEREVKQAIEAINREGLEVTRRAVDQRIKKAALVLARPEVRRAFGKLRSGFGPARLASDLIGCTSSN